MSALIDRNVDITDFIKFTAGGIRIADYNQIQSALVRRYQDVYGTDIDLSSASVDGIYINNLALIINNILQSYKTLYSNLDVNTASGVFLDTLCNLSNVTRKQPTKSIAYLTLTASQSTSLMPNTVFVDVSGEEWVYQGEEIEFSASETVSSIPVTCSKLGAVQAKAESIFQTLEVSYFTVSQPEDAIPGQDLESDADLRARRTQSSGSEGNSVLEALVGSLMSMSGIHDVKLYNNNTATRYPAPGNTLPDGTIMWGGHNVYIILRMEPNSILSDDEIGQTIYNKLTPGIATQASESATVAERKSVNIYPSLGPGQVLPTYQTVSWKKASPITPEITITITPQPYFNFKDNAGFIEISDAVKQYMNQQPIGQVPTVTDLTIEVMSADPTFKGRPTFTVDEITIDSTNPDQFYGYDGFGEVDVEEDAENPGTYIITLGGA